jgi:hypothetical protein
MTNMVTIGFCAIVLCSALHAQDFPRIEVSGGYSYLSADTNDLSDRQSANGAVRIFTMRRNIPINQDVRIR